MSRKLELHMPSLGLKEGDDNHGQHKKLQSLAEDHLSSLHNFVSFSSIYSSFHLLTQKKMRFGKRLKMISESGLYRIRMNL